MILGFLESEAKMSGSSQVFMASRGSSGYSQDVQRQITGVHILATIFVEWRTKDAWKRICWLCRSDCVVGARTTFVRHEEHAVASLVTSTYNAIISRPRSSLLLVMRPTQHSFRLVRSPERLIARHDSSDLSFGIILRRQILRGRILCRSRHNNVECFKTLHLLALECQDAKLLQ